jgi:hypothetical protein
VCGELGATRRPGTWCRGQSEAPGPGPRASDRGPNHESAAAAAKITCDKSREAQVEAAAGSESPGRDWHPSPSRIMNHRTGGRPARVTSVGHCQGSPPAVSSSPTDSRVRRGPVRLIRARIDVFGWVSLRSLPDVPLCLHNRRLSQNLRKYVLARFNPGATAPVPAEKVTGPSVGRILVI